MRWLLLLALAASLFAGEAETCLPCHEKEVRNYLSTPMGRSFYLPSSGNMPEDWNASFRHEASGRTYEMFRRGESYYVRRYRIDEKGRRVDALERKVTHVMGSGERARSYLYQSADGRIVELPVSWYAQEGRWAMAPGYDRPNHAGFTRLVNNRCMFCHNAYPDVPPEAARPGRDDDPRFPAELPLGIDCARCHGPGAKHAASAKATDIVNPAKLQPARANETCMQCHFESTTFRLPETVRRFERTFYDYQPGQPLEDYVVHFDHAPGKGWDEKFEIVSAAYRMRQSECFLRSEERLTCVACHNPHDRPAPEARAERYRRACQECHGESTLAATHEPSQTDCVACHMPRRRTEDVVHVVMTDHKITRRPPPGDLLAPLAEKTDAEQSYRGEVVPLYPKSLADIPLGELYWGIAQVREKANLDAGVERLTTALAATDIRFAEPYFALAEAQAALGRLPDAERNYRSALVRDPRRVQTYNNLANVLADMRRFDEADAYYAHALEIDPLAADVLVNRGLAQQEAGSPDKALASFRAAAVANPFLASAHANLGAALLARGAVDEARLELETALAIDPAQAMARRNYELLLQHAPQP
ncbi:MAG: tetratricopeptide repeat protein [Bryobacterales bacterium]|nr:tetratricopeptide repeat protein [Bryobacterales bacterium]